MFQNDNEQLLTNYRSTKARPKLYSLLANVCLKDFTNNSFVRWIFLALLMVMLEFNVHCIFSFHISMYTLLLRFLDREFLDRGPQVY